MGKTTIDRIIASSGKTRRTVDRVIVELELAKQKPFSKELADLIIVYVSISGDNKKEYRNIIKNQIDNLIVPKKETADDTLQKYLLQEIGYYKEIVKKKEETVEAKDKEIKKLRKSKDKQVNKHIETITDLSKKMIEMLDDISMLRVEDKGTMTRLYDKTVIADLLTDYEPGSKQYQIIKTLLHKLNQN